MKLLTATVAQTLVEMAEIARAVPVGAVVGRRLGRLVWRSEPGDGEH